MSFNFVAAVTIHSDFGAQENKVCQCFQKKKRKNKNYWANESVHLLVKLIRFCQTALERDCMVTFLHSYYMPRGGILHKMGLSCRVIFKICSPIILLHNFIDY